MSNADSWQLDSNLPAAMDFTIHSAYFGKSADYPNTQIVLVGEDEIGQPHEIRMGLGGDWETSDGGKTVHHPSKRRIHKSSIYGHWINAATGIQDHVFGRTLQDILFDSTPMQADVWNNLQLHLEREEITFGRGLEPREYLLPRKFIGIYDEQKLPLQATPEPTNIAPAESDPSSNGSPLYAEMVQLARSSGTFNEFIAQAFARDDVRGDDELARQIADERNGIWSIR